MGREQTSKEKHTNKHGEYKRSRIEEVHTPIIEAAFEGKKPLKNHYDAHFLLVAGPPGAGKQSLLARCFDNDVLKENRTIVVDREIFKQHDEFRGPKKSKRHSHMEKSPEFVDEYYDISQKIIKKALNDGYNVAFLDHGEQKKPCLKLISKAREAGHGTSVCVSVMDEKAYHSYTKERLTEGKDVNHEQRLNQHKQLAANTPDFMAKADGGMIYKEKSGRSAPLIIAEYEGGKQTLNKPQDFVKFLKQQFLNPEKSPEKAWPKIQDKTLDMPENTTAPKARPHQKPLTHDIVKSMGVSRGR